MTEPYYSDEFVTLYHGDCREVTEWLDADVLVTDPPYGRAWKQGNTKGEREKPDAHPGIAGDLNTASRDDALTAWGQRPAVVFGDLMLAPPTGTKLVAIFHKSDGVAGFRGAICDVRRDAEAIYLLGMPSGLGGRSSVFATRRMLSGSAGLTAETGHPHTKPLDVLCPLIELCPPGVVADPFAGSGSTLVAAKRLGRQSIGVELDERYCEIAAKRLSQGVLDFTGAG